MTLRACLALCSFAMLGAACTRPLEGAPCACIEGYTCCRAENRCVRGDGFCLADLACGGYHGPSCGEHGACENRDQGGVCVCSPGYDGPACAACADGYAAADGSCVRRCDLSCGAHGACALVDGAPTCDCSEGYTGPDCRECAPRYSLEAGACVLLCPSCPAHAACDLETTDAACLCAPGYAAPAEASDALSCTWHGGGESGGVTDPGFDDASTWDGRLVTFAPDAFGTGDQGVSFDPDAPCDGGFLAQTIQMPPRALAEPMVVVVDAPLDPPNGRPCFIYQTLQVGESETDLVFPADVASLRICLGDVGFGPDVRLGLMPYSERCTSSCVARMLRRLDIVPARPLECPAGPIVNGGFDGNDGWTLENRQTEVVSLASGVLTFLAQDDDAQVHAAQNVHVPGGPGTALRVKLENYASNGDPVRVQLDQQDLFALAAAAPGDRIETHCVPREFRGTFRELRLALTGNLGNSQTRVKVDEIAFVQSDSCLTEAEGIRDGTLSRAQESPWILRGDPLGSARVRLTEEGCIEGSCAHFTSQVSLYGSSQLSQWLRVPKEGRYRVSLRQRAEPASGVSITLYLGDLIAPPMRYLVNDRVTVASAWTEHRSACLPERSAGRLVRLEVALSSEESVTEPAIWIDDVQLVPATDCE